MDKIHESNQYWNDDEGVEKLSIKIPWLLKVIFIMVIQFVKRF